MLFCVINVGATGGGGGDGGAVGGLTPSGG
jgi:hypothetical protein